jgi:hexosaminidase
MRLICSVAMFIALWASAIPAASVKIIPLPEEMKTGAGAFVLDARTVIATSPEAWEQAKYLAEMLAPATGFHFEIQGLADAKDKAIVLRLNFSRAELGDEGYALDVTAERVVIEAFRPVGIFYGIQTLRQLLPPEIDGPSPPLPSTGNGSRGRWSIPCVAIRDRPRFAWRGFMLDSCRHFQNVKVVKQVIDLMARYKLNRLHWHLTEDEAWRVEIPGHPQLTTVGAWRAEPDNPHYGGFYTAQEIREIIAYAKERFVMVYPEVEMPGHATAALAAYPQFTCDGKAFAPGAPGLRYFYETAARRKAFCPSRPETYAFCEDVVDKVSAMFDAPYIHIGADEVPREQWSACPRCQALIREQKLGAIAGLQGYFT